MLLVSAVSVVWSILWNQNVLEAAPTTDTNIYLCSKAQIDLQHPSFRREATHSCHGCHLKP